MRNFSTVTKAIKHVTYNVNDEYESTVDVMDVLKSLAAAFETPFDLVTAEFIRIHQRGADDPVHVCASEYSVLIDLHAFSRTRNIVENLGILDDGYNDAFVYINLNTGISVVWAKIAI